MAAESPYAGVAPEDWKARTLKLIAAHPLDADELVEVVLGCWESIFASRLGRGFHIGRDILPKPQIMGFLLHELIPLELADRHPDEWRIDRTGRDKDLVYIPDEDLESLNNRATGLSFEWYNMANFFSRRLPWLNGRTLHLLSSMV